MVKSKDLTKGPIFIQLLTLALPIITNSLFQMAYNFFDIMWLGKLGKEELASVAAMGYIIWFGVSVVFSAKIGSEVGISQSIGKKDNDSAVKFSRNAIKLTVLWGVFFGILCFFLAEGITVNIFDLKGENSVQFAADYLKISSIGFAFLFLNMVFSGIYNGLGNSILPLIVNAIGLILNIVLDPLLIFGYFGFPALGTSGAAIASVIAQITVTITFLIILFNKHQSLIAIKRFFYFDIDIVWRILKVGLPVSAQITLFSIFAMFIASMVTKWGDAPIAVISIGANVESLSWMTASGFSTALGSFVGQNFGAGKWTRIIKGYVSALALSSSFGIIAGLIFFIFPEEVVAFFSTDEEVLEIGSTYMKIVAISQIFMTLEITTAGVFNGMGKSIPPAIVSISSNALRVIFAYILSYYTVTGLDGVWWSISMSSLLKGSVLVIWLMIVFKKKNLINKTNFNKFIKRV